VSSARVVDLDGELTIQTAAEQCPPLLAALAKSNRLEIGLAGVTELDTAGLQILLAVRREAERLGGGVEFRDPSDPVRETFAIVHLDGGL
jgi:anti-sigma B factor antagonist